MKCEHDFEMNETEFSVGLGTIKQDEDVGQGQEVITEVNLIQKVSDGVNLGLKVSDGVKLLVGA